MPGGNRNGTGFIPPYPAADLTRGTALQPIYCHAGRLVRNRTFDPQSAAVAASALLLALYGIAQYAGLLPAGKTFRVVEISITRRVTPRCWR